MTDRQLQGLRSVPLSVALGIFGGLGLAHWAACDQDDSVCMFTGAAK